MNDVVFTLLCRSPKHRADAVGAVLAQAQQDIEALGAIAEVTALRR
jgi:hypothetical protein